MREVRPVPSEAPDFGQGVGVHLHESNVGRSRALVELEGGPRNLGRLTGWILLAFAALATAACATPAGSTILPMEPSEVQRLIDALEGEVNNGGFDQFFFNSAGDEAAATIRALETIGASKTAEIVRRACGKFPGGMPPADRFARQDLLLDTVSPESQAFEEEDADFFAYEEDLAGLLAAYLARSD